MPEENSSVTEVFFRLTLLPLAQLFPVPVNVSNCIQSLEVFVRKYGYTAMTFGNNYNILYPLRLLVLLMKVYLEFKLLSARKEIRKILLSPSL